MNVTARHARLGLFALLAWPILPRPANAAPQLQLMMITKPGCVYCRQWRRDIGPGYSANPLGRQLALFETDIDGPYPDGLALARRPYVTPTFILLRDGAEMGRMEGYVGRDKFWPMLGQMVRDMPGS